MIQENFCCQWLHTDPILDVAAQMPVEGPLSVLSTVSHKGHRKPTTANVKGAGGDE